MPLISILISNKSKGVIASADTDNDALCESSTY